MTKSEQTTDESAETFDREALVEDARALVAAIKTTHPDPYIGYDGRVDLHAGLERAIRNLPENATAGEFYRRAAPLVTGMEDAHSLLHPPDQKNAPGDNKEDHRLPVSFRVIGGHLYVESVFRNSLADLLGARLLTVENESVETLTNRVASLRGTENQYTALLFASWMIESHSPLAHLLGQLSPPKEPTLRVEADGGKQSITLTPVAENREPTDELDETFPHPTGTGPRYRFYEGGDAAVFVPGDLNGYRESLEAATNRGAASAADLAQTAYERHVGGDPPADLVETVSALPSMTESLFDLIDEMAAAETDVLIIDLRNNTGGDSQFVFHIAYALWGWEGVTRMADSIRVLKRRTERHRKRYGTSNEASGDSGTPDDDHDEYDFGDFLDDPNAEEEGDESRVRDLLALSDTFRGVLDDTSHEATYEPDRIVVTVSASTMSSAFAGVAQLTSLGAEVVGVPSGQAPLSFGETVERTLPNTGLTASIAGSMYHWMPDPDTSILQPDRELTSDDFERYDRAADAVLRLAFDYAEITSSSGDPPKPNG